MWNNKKNNQNMDLIMARSADGFFAINDNDSMKWTGIKDKEFFKLFTMLGNTTLLTGGNTAALMPELPYRNLKVVTRNKSFTPGFVPMEGYLLPLINFDDLKNEEYKNCKVIGGPNFAKSVIDKGYIEYAYISVIPIELKEGLGLELTEFLNKFQYTLINFNGLEIRKYKLKGEKND